MNKTPRKTQIRDARNKIHPYGSYVLPTPPITPASEGKAAERGGWKEEEIEGGRLRSFATTVGIKEDEDLRLLTQLAERRLRELEEKRELLENQRRLSLCSKCDRVMIDPCILDCGHEFCSRCTDRLEMARENAKGDPYEIPVCPEEDCERQVLFGPVRNRTMCSIGVELGKAMEWRNVSDGFSVPMFGTGEVDYWGFMDAFRVHIVPLWQIQKGKWALRSAKNDGK
ncbi:hypothetical protein V5O48_018534, partial [Marasmius crinis-equi]